MTKPPRPDAEAPKFARGKGNNVLTKPGTDIQFNQPSAGKIARGRILPCFDFSLEPSDKAFAESYVPYRDMNDIRPDEHASWNQWYFPFEMYNFYGPNHRSFFSPRVRARLQLTDVASEANDPISRMSYLVAKDPKWTHLGHLAASTYNAPPGTPPSPLCRSRTMALMNFYGVHGDKEPQNMVLMIPEGGMAFITTQLNKFRKSSAALRDPKWPDYMFGDVTDPETGLLAWSVLKSMSGDKSSNTLTFSKLDDSAQDATASPVSKEVLGRRHNFFDTDNGIHIPTPQEVLNWVIEDGMVPLEFIKIAVGAYLDVPDAPTARRQEPTQNHTTEKSYENKETRPPTAPGAKNNSNPFTPPAEEDDDGDDIPFLAKPNLVRTFWRSYLLQGSCRA